MLLVTDQILWFGIQLPHSLINPNQIRAYGISVNDNPFGDSCDFGIDLDEGLILFETEGTIISFETRSPTDHKLKELPVVLLTGSHWYPKDNIVYPHRNTAEFNELRAIWLLRQEQEDLGRLKNGETDAIPCSISLISAKGVSV
eukprot:1148198-Ditylum_brightwellii.AAC.1